MSDVEADVENARRKLAALRTEISKRIVGQQALVNGIIAGLLSAGHVLIEGVPGLGKTLLVKTLSDVLDLEFARIQFTPDLMPADIIGTQIVAHDEDGHRHFQFQAGPVFTQLLLADEINRATPKTQSALLEAMEENSVTVGRTSHQLKQPFMVLATQNPIEMEGTYPLPEAQLDRFILKLVAEYPSATELTAIVERTTGTLSNKVDKVLSAAELIALREQARATVIARHVTDYAVRLVMATHPHSDNATTQTTRFVQHGASPRGVQSLILVAKAHALGDGRINVSFEDLRRATLDSLRHRILLNFDAHAQGVKVEHIIENIVKETAETPN